MAGMADIELWEKRVAAWRASGMTSTAYCAGRGFSAGGLRHWAHQLKKREGDKRTGTAQRVRLARVERASPSTAPATTLPERRVTGPAAQERVPLVLEVEGICITLWPGFDAPTLASVLAVLSQHARSSRRAA